jgi:hypothetical protein
MKSSNTQIFKYWKFSIILIIDYVENFYIEQSLSDLTLQ